MSLSTLKHDFGENCNWQYWHSSRTCKSRLQASAAAVRGCLETFRTLRELLRILWNSTEQHCVIYRTPLSSHLAADGTIVSFSTAVCLCPVRRWLFACLNLRNALTCLLLATLVNVPCCSDVNKATSRKVKVEANARDIKTKPMTFSTTQGNTATTVHQIETVM